jgi:hypothetical protein
LIRSRQAAHAVALALSAALLTGVAAAPALAKTADWTGPFTIAAASQQDLLPAQIALGAGGQAVAFGAFDAELPGSGRALLASAPAGGKLRAPVAVVGARQVLAVAYLGRELALLVGEGTTARACCERARVLLLRSGRRVAEHLLASGLDGPSLGSLVVVHGRLLAALASTDGVWVAQSDRRGGFGPTRRLDRGALEPGSLGAATLDPGHSLLGWSVPASPFGPSDSEILIARGTGSAPPARPRTAFRAATGDQIDELALAGGGGRGTLAWTESSAVGATLSQLLVAEPGSGVAPQRLSSAGEQASGVALAGNPRGAAVIAYRACEQSTGACELRAALRRGPRAAFGAPRTLGSIDPTQFPAVAISATGRALVGFVSGGHPFVVTASSGRFASARRLSDTAYAADLTVAFAPSGSSALAVWTQGGFRESLIAARLR